jgi:GNAT superfamily N-acetyltransferase
MKSNGKGVKSQFKVRAFHKDRLDGEILHMMFLSAFYGLETAKLFGWSVEHRYGQMTQAQVMLRAGHSRMYYVAGEDGMPMGMLITTKTDKQKIKRMDAIFVFPPFRGAGVAQALLSEARAGGDLHSYAAPTAVEWHLKNGFRNLGPNEDEGTFEMFTGSYKPIYGFSFAMPIPTAHDRAAIRELEALEQQMLAKR